MKTNFDPKLNKSENFIENKKINLSPIKYENSEVKTKGTSDNNYNSSRRLDFYALGKVDNYPEIIIQKYNNGLQSCSNNLIIRNYLSVNSPNFDDLKKTKTKKLMTIYHQDVEDKNYLNPNNPYKNENKYDLSKSSINQEMYNLFKKKLFIKGDPSSIEQGKQINKIDFLNRKKKLINNNNKIILSSTGEVNTIREKFFNKIKLHENPLNIKEKESEEKEYICDNKIQKKFGNKKLLRSLSSSIFMPKNQNNLKHELLKANNFHVKRNHNKILRSRNWWKAE